MQKSSFFAILYNIALNIAGQAQLFKLINKVYIILKKAEICLCAFTNLIFCSSVIILHINFSTKYLLI